MAWVKRTGGAMGEYREEWDNYLCLVEKETASMFLDLGYARVAPLAEKPWLIRVRLACRAVRENGLPTSDEMTALQDLEEEVLSRVEGRASLSLVGSVTTGGAREIVFYASTDDALKEDELTMVVPKRRAAPFLVAEEDPAWEYYLQFMQPSAEEYRRMLDTRVLRNLDRDGDVSSTPRRVDHWVYFEDAGARDRFVAWAVGARQKRGVASS